MYSKWKVWDFFKSKNTSIPFDSYGIHAFYTFDSLIASFVKDSLPVLDNGDSYQVLMGAQVTVEWFEDNFKSLDLFGNNQSYFIHFAEKLNSEILDLIIEGDLLLDNRFLILSFSSSTDAFKALSKKESIQSIEITEPMFWEYRELLEFLSSKLGVFLDYEASSFMIESIDPTCQEFFRYLNQLGVLYPETTIKKEQIIDILGSSRLDQFRLADLFGSKKFTLFFEELTKLEIDENSLRIFFMFMQKHMGKISDLRFLDNKSKLSKYDRQLIAHNKLWDKASVNRSIKYFKGLEQNLKTKPYVFKHLLKKDYYRSF